MAQRSLSVQVKVPKCALAYMLECNDLLHSIIGVRIKSGQGVQEKATKVVVFENIFVIIARRRIGWIRRVLGRDFAHFSTRTLVNRRRRGRVIERMGIGISTSDLRCGKKFMCWFQRTNGRESLRFSLVIWTHALGREIISIMC